MQKSSSKGSDEGQGHPSELSTHDIDDAEGFPSLHSPTTAQPTLVALAQKPSTSSLLPETSASTGDPISSLTKWRP